MRVLRFLFSRFFICITVIAALVAAIIFLCLYIHSLLPAAGAAVLSYLLSLTAACAVLCSDRPEEFSRSWLAVIILLPVAGATVYAVTALSSKRKSRHFTLPDCTYADGFEYFDDGKTLIDSLIERISRAERFVYLEFYIIAKGTVWSAFYRELFKLLARGVEIKIVYDGVGSALRAPFKDFKKLKEAGAQIKVCNKLMPAPLSRLNLRDHRKIALVDGILFLGGVNIADEYCHATSPHGFWKDGGVMLWGQVAAVYKNLFNGCFDKSEQPLPAGEGRYKLLPVADSPADGGHVAEDLLAGAIGCAKERVLIFTPYLCVGEKLFDALCFAAARGVRVSVIIPGVPDKKLTYAITKAYANRLAAHGVEIYEYTPGFMHFKGVVCDGGALIGSYNFDFRSLQLNRECGVWAEKEMADVMAGDFENCLLKCIPFRRGRLPFAVARLFAPLV